MGNIRIAFRTLFKTPLITGVAVLSLALGIGTNAAIYSIFDEVLKSPLPVVQPERLVNLSNSVGPSGTASSNNAGHSESVFSYPMFRDLEAAQTLFSGVAAHRIFPANVAYRDQTLRVDGMLVSGSYFPLLGVTPALGRLLTPADDDVIGAHTVAVLGYTYWRTRLGGDRGVLNQQFIINGKSMTVVGVAAKGFDGTVLGVHPDVFVPISMRHEMSPSFAGFTDRRNYWIYLFARLKPGVTIEQASASANRVFHGIITDVEIALQKHEEPAELARFRGKTLILTDGQLGQSTLRATAQTPLYLMLGTTGIVILIACANVANLLLARGAGRASDIAVRVSLGATRMQLVGQLLTESLALASMGGALSLLAAYWTLGLFGALLPPNLGSAFHVELRPAALLFAGVVTLGTGILFGLFPALHASRPDLVTGLRSATGKHSGSHAAARIRSALVAAQIALSLALLSTAGLFTRSLRNVSRVDLGLTVDNVVTFGISPKLNGYDGEHSRAMFTRAEAALAALPGVTGVTSAAIPLLDGDDSGNGLIVEGFTNGPGINPNGYTNEVGPGYFHVLGIPLLTGREFTVSDRVGSPKVAIVNEAFVKKFHLRRDPVGQRFTDEGGPLDIEIVGLVRNAAYSDVKDTVRPIYYTPYLEDPQNGTVSVYVRTAGQPSHLLRAIPGVIASLDPNLPVEDLKTLPQQVRENTAMDRMVSSMSTGFALLATLLAAIGLYGVLAYSVAQRTREIGVRQALGATARDIRVMVLRQVGALTVVGGTIGVIAALGVGRAAQSLLYHLDGTDPLVLLLATAALGLVAFAAGYIPASKAAQVAPMEALREQ